MDSSHFIYTFPNKKNQSAVNKNNVHKLRLFCCEKLSIREAILIIVLILYTCKQDSSNSTSIFWGAQGIKQYLAHACVIFRFSGRI